MIKNEKAVVLLINNNELTPKVLSEAMKKELNTGLSSSKATRAVKTVEQLTRGKSVKKVPTDHATIQSFRKFARSFSVGYVALQNGTEFQVYFTARKEGAIANAFRAYINKVIEDEKDTRESLLDRLKNDRGVSRNQRTTRKDDDNNSKEKIKQIKKKKEFSR